MKMQSLSAQTPPDGKFSVLKCKLTKKKKKKMAPRILLCLQKPPTEGTLQEMTSQNRMLYFSTDAKTVSAHPVCAQDSSGV